MNTNLSGKSGHYMCPNAGDAQQKIARFRPTGIGTSIVRARAHGAHGSATRVGTPKNVTWRRGAPEGIWAWQMSNAKDPAEGGPVNHPLRVDLLPAHAFNGCSPRLNNNSVASSDSCLHAGAAAM